MSADALILCGAVILNTLGCTVAFVLIARRVDLLEQEVFRLAESLRLMANALEVLTRDENWVRARKGGCSED